MQLLSTCTLIGTKPSQERLVLRIVTSLWLGNSIITPTRRRARVSMAKKAASAWSLMEQVTEPTVQSGAPNSSTSRRKDSNASRPFLPYHYQEVMLP